MRSACEARAALSAPHRQLTDIRIDVTDFMQMAKTLYGIIEGDSTCRTYSYRS